MADQPSRVPIGKLGRPHGIKGEIRLFLFNPASRTVREGLSATLQPEEGPGFDVTVEKARYTDDFVIVKFAEIDDRGDIDAHKHAHLEVDFDDLPQLEDDDFFYEIELVGAPVFVAEEEDGLPAEDAGPIGRIDRFFPTGANDVLVVDTGGDGKEDELFVPLVDHAVALLDFDDRRVVLQPLEIWAPVDYDIPEGD